MMQLLVSDAQRLAVKNCLAGNIPFALWFVPGEATGSFIASSRCESTSTHLFCSDKSYTTAFAVSMFDSPGQCVVINGDIDEHGVSPADGNADCEVKARRISTDFEEYSAAASTIITMLQEHRGKLVLSRIICREGANPIDVAEAYFSELPSTMRYIYYTPQTGVWIGATPELLVSYDAESHCAWSMSLAGTRLAGQSGDWDSKNSEEHDYVTAHIADVLSRHSQSIEISDRFALKYGSIEHLCEKITAQGVTNIGSIISELSPTPAVSGSIDNSVSIIGSLEKHHRYCYGGWIGIRDGGNVNAYVNLRCALASKQPDDTYIYNVYAGGGLTADSSVDDEWEETNKKATLLLQSIENTTI